MREGVRKDLLFGILVFALGVFFLCMTFHVPTRQGVDAATVPYILSVMLVVLGCGQMLLCFCKRGGTEVQKKASGTPVDIKTLGITAALLVLYVGSLEFLGFCTASAMYLFVQILVLTPAGKKKPYVFAALLSVAGAVSIYCIFRFGFDLMLPEGFMP